MRNVQIFQLRNQTESSQISVLEFISTLALASRTLIFYINWALSAGGHKVVRAHTVEKIVRSRTRAAITRMLLMRGDLSYPSIIFFHELVRFDFSSLVNVVCHYVTDSLFLRNWTKFNVTHVIQSPPYSICLIAGNKVLMRYCVGRQPPCRMTCWLLGQYWKNIRYVSLNMPVGCVHSGCLR